MSTKAIRKALKHLKNNDMDEELASAMKEVEAIERAAKALVEVSGVDYLLVRTNVREGDIEVLEHIARDAP